jgi:DNA mismatch repair protein MutS
MTFHSILFERPEDSPKEELLEAPVFFVDLNLDQIVDAITAGKEAYHLKPFFYISLNDVEAIKYRQEISQDLENEILLANIDSFALKMTTMRRYLSLEEELYYKYHKEAWFLEAVQIYCETVTCLVHDLSHANLESRGLLMFREYVTSYADSSSFTSLLAETQKLKSDLSTIKYCVLVKDNGVKVRRYESEIDYSIEVEQTFEKFKQGEAKDYKTKAPIWSGMNHVEAAILDFVSKLYPDAFLCLDNYCLQNRSFLDETIAAFDREIQFYVAYLKYISKLRLTGLKFCYPQLSDTDKEVYDYEGFDLALANKLVAENSSVVSNDFYLKGNERIFVVSGPNQGGKTTFGRTFGQLHYLACLGCPVPGKKARLFLFDSIFTHFERREDIRNLRGKLQEDLVRIHDILNRATPNSVMILNEIFTSTTLRDAVFLSKKVMERIMELGSLCVWVTFIDELASFDEQTVSMVSTVVPENPALRTYKIVRRPADGLSYAISIAEKHRITYDCLKERIKS